MKIEELIDSELNVVLKYIKTLYLSTQDIEETASKLKEIIIHTQTLIHDSVQRLKDNKSEQLIKQLIDRCANLFQKILEIDKEFSQQFRKFTEDFLKFDRFLSRYMQTEEHQTFSAILALWCSEKLSYEYQSIYSTVNQLSNLSNLILQQINKTKGKLKTNLINYYLKKLTFNSGISAVENQPENVAIGHDAMQNIIDFYKSLKKIITANNIKEDEILYLNNFFFIVILLIGPQAQYFQNKQEKNQYTDYYEFILELSNHIKISKIETHAYVIHITKILFMLKDANNNIFDLSGYFELTKAIEALKNFFDKVDAYLFHASDNIALHESTQVERKYLHLLLNQVTDHQHFIASYLNSKENFTKQNTNFMKELAKLNQRLKLWYTSPKVSKFIEESSKQAKYKTKKSHRKSKRKTKSADTPEPLKKIPEQSSNKTQHGANPKTFFHHDGTFVQEGYCLEGEIEEFTFTVIHKNFQNILKNLEEVDQYIKIITLEELKTKKDIFITSKLFSQGLDLLFETDEYFHQCEKEIIELEKNVEQNIKLKNNLSAPYQELISMYITTKDFYTQKYESCYKLFADFVTLLSIIRQRKINENPNSWYRTTKKPAPLSQNYREKIGELEEMSIHMQDMKNDSKKHAEKIKALKERKLNSQDQLAADFLTLSIK